MLLGLWTIFSVWKYVIEPPKHNGHAEDGYLPAATASINGGGTNGYQPPASTSHRGGADTPSSLTSASTYDSPSASPAASNNASPGPASRNASTAVSVSDEEGR